MWLGHSVTHSGRRDVRAQGAGDLVERSAAVASNSTKAKSTKSLSLILIYICLLVPLVRPCPRHRDDEGCAQIPPPCRPNHPHLLSLTPSPQAQAIESLSPSAVIWPHPRHLTAPSASMTSL